MTDQTENISSFNFYQQILTVSCKNNSNDSHSIFKEAIKGLKSQIKKNPSSRVDSVLVYETVENPYILPKLKDEEKSRTRWEIFASEKGIKQKKKGRRVFCEETNSWEFKFGSKSIKNQKLQSGLLELPENSSISKLKREKQKRIAKNKKNMLANKKKSKGL